MIPGVTIKASIASVNGARGSGGGGGRGGCEPISRGFRWQSRLRKFLGYIYHLDWLKIDLNATKIITVQVYKRTKI